MSESVTNSYEIKYRTEADRAEANKELGHALRREALRSMIGNLFKTPSSEVRLAAVAERLTEPEEGKPGADSISSWLARYTKHIEMVGPTKAFKDKEQYVKELKIATADQRLNEAEESDIERPLSNHIALSLGRFIAYETQDPDEIIEEGQMLATTGQRTFEETIPIGPNQ